MRLGFGGFGLAGVLLAALAPVVRAQIVTTVVDNGDPNDLYDIVIVGDGYQASERGQFDADVDAVVRALRDQAVNFPLNAYFGCFNIHSVFRASVESGADDPSAGVMRNTVYDTTYNYGGSQRCLYPATGAGRALAAADAALAPDSDGRIMMLVNSSQYGGCASTFSVSYTGLFGPGVQVHEWGHSFAGLADEYDYGAAGTYVGPEFFEPNVTNSASGMRWSQWLGANGPNGTVGAYQGARYHRTGAYRPEPNCNMRNIGQPFCSVCREHIIRRFHALCEMIGDTAGPALVLQGTVGSFTFVNRLAARPHTVEWRVDGGPWVLGADVFDWDTTNVAPGSHTIEMKLVDTSPEVRVSSPGELEYGAAWNVFVQPVAGLISLDGRGETRVVDGGRDVDGDSFDDVVVGTPGDGAGGSVTVFSGVDRAVVHHWVSSTPGDEFGKLVRMLGDVDADGHADVAVGVGDRVIVYSGASGSEVFTLTAPGAATHDDFGRAVDSAGDTNGDGFDDILVGAPGGLGHAHLFSGFDGSLIRTHPGNLGPPRYGNAVAGIGDVNFDGLDDYAIGRPGFGDAGLVEVRLGSDGSVWFTLTNPLATGQPDEYGTSVAGIGDFDGDTFPDFAIGGPRHAAGGVMGGLGVVVSGFSGQPLFHVEGSGSLRLGTTVARVGDVDGNGRDDVAFVEGGLDALGDPARDGIVVAGETHATVYTISRWQSFAGAGDTDGDGFAEFVAGGFLAESAAVLNLGLTGSPGRWFTTGAPCRGGDPTRRPRMTALGTSRLGGTLFLRLRGAAPLAPTALGIGAATDVALDPLGMNGCTLLSSIAFSSPGSTDANGSRFVYLSMPQGPGLLGTAFSLQWLTADPAAPYPIGVSLSDALRLEIGS